MPTGRHEEYFAGGGQGMTDIPSSGGNPGPLELKHRDSGGAGPPGYQHQDQFQTAQLPQQQQPQAPHVKYRFTAEEQRVLRECNRESFYYRCLPIGTALGLSAYYGVRNGYLKPSPRFGPGPKMFFASVVGYFLGKFSYQSTCAEKLMTLPNSQLGEVLRKQKGRMGFQETLSLEPGFASAVPVGVPAFANSDFNKPSTYSDVGDTRPMGSLDNEGSSSHSGYDYSHSTSTQNYDTTQQMLDDENLPPKRPQLSTSYEDLRRQNRIDYESRQHRNFSSPGAPPQSQQSDSFGTQTGGYDRRAPSYPGNQSKPKNKYGDDWDDKAATY